MLQLPLVLAVVAMTCHLPWSYTTVGSFIEMIGCAASGTGEIKGPVETQENGASAGAALRAVGLAANEATARESRRAGRMIGSGIHDDQTVTSSPGAGER